MRQLCLFPYEGSFSEAFKRLDGYSIRVVFYYDGTYFHSNGSVIYSPEEFGWGFSLNAMGEYTRTKPIEQEFQKFLQNLEKYGEKSVVIPLNNVVSYYKHSPVTTDELVNYTARVLRRCVEHLQKASEFPPLAYTNRESRFKGVRL